MAKRICILVALFAAVAFPALAEEQCPPLKVLTSIDLMMPKNGMVGVPVTVAGEKTFFILDTAAPQSRISAELAKKLNLPLEHSGRVTLVNARGNISTTFASVPSFDLGRLTYHSAVFWVIAEPANPAGPQGVLGGDMLRNYDIDLDFAAQKMNIISRDHCADNVVYWKSTMLAKVPMGVGHNNRIFFNATLDGHDLTAVLSTGLAHSAINISIAKSRFDVDETSPGSVAVNPNNKDTLYHHRFGTLNFQDVSVSNPDILLMPDIGDKIPGAVLRGGDRFLARMNLDQPELLVGMSTLRQMHVYIDYHNQTIYFTPAAPSPTAAAPSP